VYGGDHLGGRCGEGGEEAAGIPKARFVGAVPGTFNAREREREKEEEA
jgi:hypothetical protein